MGKRLRPMAAVLDSQTARSDPHGDAVSYDAGQQTKGRKCLLLVVALGLVLGPGSGSGQHPERARVLALLEPLLPYLSWRLGRG